MLVKVTGKKSVKYYAGKLISIGENNKLEYLRRIQNTNFVIDSSETYDFLPDDLVRKLPPSKPVIKGTMRQGSTLTFDVSFSGYDVN